MGLVFVSAARRVLKLIYRMVGTEFLKKILGLRRVSIIQGLKSDKIKNLLEKSSDRFFMENNQGWK